MTQSSDAVLTRLMALHPKVIDLTLDRVWRLLEALGNPEDSLPPVIHIAGTNGKGSTQAMIRAGLEAAGHKVHAYTSPHLVRFHERIRLAGDLISEAALTDLLDECEAANEGAPITYFEITTCAALLAFSRVPADYLLLEVGLGGRLDATNVIAAPRMTVITPVSMDHEAFLGDALTQIAFEKAGIIKRHVPVVVGPQEDAALDVIEAQAARLGAPRLVSGQQWHAAPDRDRMMFQDEDGLLDLPRPNLSGAHQIQNAGAALMVLRALGCDPVAYEGAVTQATWPGRLQRLRGDTFGVADAEIWLDGGHNPAAGLALAEAFGAMPARPLFLVCGMLNTKNPKGFLKPFVGLAEHVIGLSIPGEANTLSAEAVAASAAMSGMESSVAPDVQTAVAWAFDKAPDARVLICGSLYLAGHLLALQD